MSIYQQALAIARFYMGPAGQTFLQRQITRHLALPSCEDLKPPQLAELGKRCELSAALVMDAAKAAEFSKKIVGLATR